jgi:hypothetical protein
MVREVNQTRAVVRRRRRHTLFGVASALLLAAGIIAAVVAFAPNKNAEPERVSNEPAQLPAKETKAKLPDEAKQVARRFVQTAVARKNLAEAYDLVGPNIRGNLTREEWLTETSVILPDRQARRAPFRSTTRTDEALIEVALLPKENAGVKHNSSPRARRSGEERQALGRRSLTPRGCHSSLRELEHKWRSRPCRRSAPPTAAPSGCRFS